MLDAYCAEYQPATPSAEFLVRQVAMADWRRLRLHRIEASFHTIRHKELELSRRWRISSATTTAASPSSTGWTPARKTSWPTSTATRFARTLRQKRRQELGRRPVALVSTAPVGPPKPNQDPAQPKIINIETVERVPAP